MAKHGTGVMSIPGRLQALGYETYRGYLKSTHWADVRSRFFRSKLVSRTTEGRICCGACGKCDVRLSVHHRTYKRLGREWMMDLMMVCDDCHSEVHKMYGSLWGNTKLLAKNKGRQLSHLQTIPKIFSDETFGSPADEKLPWKE
jgi:hypothetical protein